MRSDWRRLCPYAWSIPRRSRWSSKARSSGILVGRGGATLGALQELARTVVQSRTAGPTERILVDVAGYRAKRSEALQRFTRQVAEEVLSSGSEQALEPMLAPDRKVVHDTVSEIDGVETRSEGEEPRRYVVVSPPGVLTDTTDRRRLTPSRPARRPIGPAAPVSLRMSRSPED